MHKSSYFMVCLGLLVLGLQGVSAPPAHGLPPEACLAEVSGVQDQDVGSFVVYATGKVECGRAYPTLRVHWVRISLRSGERVAENSAVCHNTDRCTATASWAYEGGRRGFTAHTFVSVEGHPPGSFLNGDEDTQSID